MQKPWFKRKLYGFGWYPATWQGWLVMAAYVYTVVKVFLLIDKGSHSVSDTLEGFVFPFVFLTVALLFVCYKKGEKPKWQWGKRR